MFRALRITLVWRWSRLWPGRRWRLRLLVLMGVRLSTRIRTNRRQRLSVSRGTCCADDIVRINTYAQALHVKVWQWVTVFYRARFDDFGYRKSCHAVQILRLLHGAQQWPEDI